MRLACVSAAIMTVCECCCRRKRCSGRSTEWTTQCLLPADRRHGVRAMRLGTSSRYIGQACRPCHTCKAARYQRRAMRGPWRWRPISPAGRRRSPLQCLPRCASGWVSLRVKAYRVGDHDRHTSVCDHCGKASLVPVCSDDVEPHLVLSFHRSYVRTGKNSEGQAMVRGCVRSQMRVCMCTKGIGRLERSPLGVVRLLMSCHLVDNPPESLRTTYKGSSMCWHVHACNVTSCSSYDRSMPPGTE